MGMRLARFLCDSKLLKSMANGMNLGSNILPLSVTLKLYFMISCASPSAGYFLTLFSYINAILR
jgi:hypothetical protein